MAKVTLPEPDAMPLAPPDDDAVPDCPQFEQTLRLIDGLLPEGRLPEARRHIEVCAECGPLGRDWHAISNALRAAAHDEAYAAEAELEQRLRRTTQEISSATTAPTSARARRRGETTAGAAPPQRSRWRRGWGAVAAAASSIAAACVLLMMRSDGLTSSMPPRAPMADAPAVQLQSVTFDDADGMLLQGDDGLTVIWITEHEET